MAQYQPRVLAVDGVRGVVGVHGGWLWLCWRGAGMFGGGQRCRARLVARSGSEGGTSWRWPGLGLGAVHNKFGFCSEWPRGKKDLYGA